MVTPPFWSQAAGLLLFAVLVAVVAGAHRLYLRVRIRRLYASAERPLPRVRDEVHADTERAS